MGIWTSIKPRYRNC